MRKLTPQNEGSLPVEMKNQFTYIRFTAVPGDWSIGMRGYAERDCHGEHTDRFSENSKGYQDYCQEKAKGDLAFRCGNYYFKSGEGSQTRAEPDSNCSLPDALVHENGTMYNLRGLEEDEIVKAVSYLYRALGRFI